MTDSASSFIEVWRSYWFQSTSHFQYGLYRIAFVLLFGHFFLFTLLPRFRPYLDFPPELLLRSHYLKYIPLPRLGSYETIRRLVFLTLLFALLGVATRLSIALMAFWYLYVCMYMWAFGFYGPSNAVPTIVLFAMPFFPNIDALSIDSLLNGLSLKDSVLLAQAPTQAWPANLSLILFSLSFFSAGWAKLRYGSRFLSGATLAFYFKTGVSDTYFTSHPKTPEAAKWRDGFGLESFCNGATSQSITPIGKLIGASPAATLALSVATFIFEIAFPLALISNEFRNGMLIIALLFHIGVYLTMKVNFTPYVASYLIFVDWTPILSRL